MKRTRPDVKVMDAPSKPGTYLVHPVVGAVDHKPWARVTILPRWYELAEEQGILSSVPAGMGLTDAQRKGFQIKILSHHLQTQLNAKDPTTRPSFVPMGCRVELRSNLPAGRLAFVGYDGDKEILQGTADPIVISDLLWTLCPMDTFNRDRA